MDEKSDSFHTHSRKIKMEPENTPLEFWKRKNIFQTIIFRFYVNLLGCKSFGIVEQKRQFLLSNFLKSTTIHLGEGGIDCPDSTYIIYLSYIVYIISKTIYIYIYIHTNSPRTISPGNIVLPQKSMLVAAR